MINNEPKEYCLDSCKVLKQSGPFGVNVLTQFNVCKQYIYETNCTVATVNFNLNEQS